MEDTRDAERGWQVWWRGTVKETVGYFENYPFFDWQPVRYLTIVLGWALKSREVSWTPQGVRLSFAVPGEIRKEVVLDLQESPEEIKSREVELGSESWTPLCFSCSSTAVLRTLSL